MNSTGASSNFMKTFYRGVPLVVAVVAACVVMARTWLKYATPMYESTAKIKLADAKEGVPNTNLYKDFDVFASSNKIGAEVELLKSEVLIGKVLDILHIDTVVYRVGEIHIKELYRESPLEVHVALFSDKLLDTRIGLVINGRKHLELKMPDGKVYKGEIGKPVTGNGFVVTVTLNMLLLKSRPNMDVDDNYEFAIYSRRKLIRSVVSGMDVTSVDKDIPILRVSYKCPDAQKSADVVNAIAGVYIKDYIEEKSRSADTTEQFLNEQLREYSALLAGSERRVQQYRDQNNIVNIRQETETDLRKIADMKKQLASVQMNLLAIDSLTAYMKANRGNFVNIAPNFEAFTDLLSTEIVKKVKTLQAEKRDLLLLYTPQNPKVQVVDKKINDLADYLDESIRNTQTNLRIKYNDLRRTIAEAEQGFEGLPEKERDMTILERDFGMNEQIYRFIREKRTEAQIAKAATISFHRIISRGEVSEHPVSPNAKLITVFSGFLGFVFSIIFIFAVHSAKARVDNEQNIYRSSDTPLEKSIPMLKKDTDKSMFFDKWMLEMELKNRLHKGAVICVSSSEKREGKAYVTAAMVKAAQNLGKRVLLVAMEDNMAEFATDEYDVVTPLMVSYKWHIPQEWECILDRWRSEYDIVVIRNFPVKHSNVSILPMAKADLNLFLLDSRRTRLSEVIIADDMKERLSLPGFMYVLNRAGYAPGLLTYIVHILKKMRNVRR